MDTGSSGVDAAGLRWRVDLPDAAELDVLYSTGFYHASPPRGGSSVALLHRLNNEIRLREIQDVAPGRLLDIGSGKGRFLAAARGRGWDVIGVEYASATAAAATAAYGIPVISGDFLDAPIEGPFDVVTMWHVLEHLPDPPAALRRVEGLLRPGGRGVVGSVPNIDSTQAHLGGEAWLDLDPARHLFHFSPRSLRAMVEGSGFAVDRIGHTYPEMEFIGLIQTVLTKARIEEDLLYRFFKGGAVGDVRSARGGVDRPLRSPSRLRPRSGPRSLRCAGPEPASSSSHAEPDRLVAPESPTTAPGRPVIDSRAS